MTSSIDDVATVESIWSALPARAALATAISPSAWKALLLPVGASPIGLA